MHYFFRVLCLLFLVILLNLNIHSVSAQEDKQYIQDHLLLSKVLSYYYNIPVPIILSVALVESGAGTSEVTKVLRNHFGIMGCNTIRLRSGRKSRYKQYRHELYSYIDFCNYICNKKYFAKLKRKKNLEAWIKALSASGYSEDPDEWGGKLRYVIKKYKL